MLLWTLRYRYLFESVFLFSLDIYPGVKLLDHLVVTSFVTSDEPSYSFYSSCTIYVPVNSVWRFLILHTLTNICYLSSFWEWPFWEVCSDIWPWFWLAFPWWLVLLNIFSCTVGHLYVFFEEYLFRSLLIFYSSSLFFHKLLI